MRAQINLFLLLCIPLFAVGQTDSIHSVIHKKRLNTFIISSSVTYTATLAGLNHLWYKDAERQSFRFFNDNAEWKQIDKVGHFYSAFYLSYTTSKVLQWANVPVKKSDLIGAISGFAVLVPIEIFDGFSDAYGASTGDLIFDAAGSSFYLLQKTLWKEVRIYPKFSFQRTGYAQIRPNVLGDGLSSEFLKDYNGQTYWLSFDLDKFSKLPRWLNVAVGYGANGMVYARDTQNLEAGYAMPVRQFYLSLDVDLTSIKTKSKALRTLLFVANMIKVPSPTLEFSSKGLTFHTLYF